MTSLLQTTGELQALCEYRVEKFPKQEDLFASALDLASQLESSRAGFGGQRLEKLLPGRWRLLLTNSPPVIKNAGSITGLGALPGAKCSKVEVVLERGGRASTEEAVSVLGLMNGVNALTGKWRLGGKGNSVLEVTYAEASLMGKSKFRADSKAVLETTYCGDQIRIGRSKTGDVFVFQRV